MKLNDGYRKNCFCKSFTSLVRCQSVMMINIIIISFSSILKNKKICSLCLAIPVQKRNGLRFIHTWVELK